MLRFLAQRERPIHLGKLSVLAAMPKGFCNGCKASELFRLRPVILHLRPHRTDSRAHDEVGIDGQSLGNGTAFSAVAPSQRPKCDAHQSKIFGSGIPTIMSPRPEYLDA